MKILGQELKKLKECLEILRLGKVGSFVELREISIEKEKVGGFIQELEATLLVENVKVGESQYPVILEGNSKFQMEISWKEREFSKAVMVWHSYSHTETFPGIDICVTVTKI